MAINKTRIAYCAQCGEDIGYELSNGLRFIKLTEHTQKRHPIRIFLAKFLYPIFPGLQYAPIKWRIIGKES